MVGSKLPRTSVVIPARDAGDTLAATLESLLAQSDPDWEAVLVDDASTDQTSDIISRYVRQDNRFIGRRGNGAGVAAARNIGLAVARGNRLVFLDSDDWLDRQFLALMNQALTEDDHVVAAYCGYRRVLPDGTQTEPVCDPAIAENPFAVFARSCATAIHAVLIRRAAVSAVGGFDTSLQTCEDWDLWQRVARRGGNWRRLDRPLSFYRVRRSSLTRNCRQLLIDAAIVIDRGFSADSRLPADRCAHPHGATTALGWTAALALAHFALWCGGFDCGGGGSGVDAVHCLGRTPPDPAHTESLAGAVFSGLAVGLPAVPSVIAARWPDYGARLTAFFARLGEAWSDPAAARRLLYQVERLVLFFDDLAEPRRLAFTLGRRIFLHRLASVTPPPGVDRLIIDVYDRRARRLQLTIGVLGTITVRNWIEIAVARLGVRQVLAAAAPTLARSLCWRLPSLLRRGDGAAQRAVFDQPQRWPLQPVRLVRRLLPALAGPRIPAGSHRDMLQRLLAAADHEARGEMIRPAGERQPLVVGERKHSAGRLAASGRCRSLPVLLYRLSSGRHETVSKALLHSQMEWLHRHGYHSIIAADLLHHLAAGQPFADRQVMICFVGAFGAFIDHAWPVVQRFGLHAELFITPGAGRRRAPAGSGAGGDDRLPDAASVSRVSAQGVSFGALVGDNGGVDGLSTAALAEALAWGRAVLSHRLGQSIASFAVAGDREDERLPVLAAGCGYRLGFSHLSRPVTLVDEPLAVPRLAIQGDQTLDDFAHLIESCR